MVTMVESSGKAKRNQQLQKHLTRATNCREFLLSTAETTWITSNSYVRAKFLTFTRTSTARSVSRQHRGSPEGSLQVIVLLRQLLKSLFQSDTLVSFIL